MLGLRHLFLAGTVMLLMGSCAASRKVSYLQDIGTDTRIECIERIPVTVQPGDKVSIVVNSKNPELADMFNLPVITHRVGQPMNDGNGYTQQMSSYTVDSDGKIDFPILGEIEVEGLGREEIAALVKNELVSRDLVRDAVVIVEFMDMGVSVTGEVNRPGRFAIQRDHITIFDALSMAGDLTIYGKRDNVLVVRRENGGETFYRVNLCDSESVYNSPVFYLRQNDMVYVEPNEVRARQSTVNGNNIRSTSFWVSLGSLLTTLLVLILK